MKRSGSDSKDGKQEQVHLVDVIRHGQSIQIPEDVDLEVAIDVLQRKAAEEEQMIVIDEKVQAFPWDGAIALKKALEQTFGISLQRSGFFGARQISVEVGVNETIQVPWGSFDLPGIEGTIGCGVTVDEGRLVFEVTASVKRKNEKAIKQIVDLTREIVARESIYRGKAIKMKFRDSSGKIDKSAQPRFMDLSNIPPTVFTADIQRQIDTHIMTPIMYPDAVRQAGTPFKRGILLAGRPGVGKSLLAANIAKVATASGSMFLYVEDAAELPDAIQFGAMHRQPCVIFVEDVDRVTSGERGKDLDAILNHLDGVATKSAEIMTIMTSNVPEKIHRAVLRPGRVDTLLFIDPPDDEAVQKLVRFYGRDFIDADEDLRAVGLILKGRIPAVIREVVESSKLETVRRTRGKGGKVIADDIVDAAKTYIRNEERLTPPVVEGGDASIEAFGRGIAGPIVAALAQVLQKPEEFVLPYGPNGGHLKSRSQGRD